MSSQETKSKRKPILMVSSAVYGFEELLDRIYATLSSPELGYEVWTTPDYFASLYDDVREAGSDLGLAHFGGRALSSLRLEKCYGSFNKDFRPDYTPAETGLDRFIDFGKSGFTGREAAMAGEAGNRV